MLVVTLTVLLLACVSGNHKDFRRLDCIRLEPQCSEVGGMCVISTDCPSGHHTKEKGLCPKQRSQGVECCYGLSVKETRCQKHGGHCIPCSSGCNERLIYKEATDCQIGEKCCILV